MHKRIIEPVLSTLDEGRVGYFTDIVSRLEKDRRTERFPNLVYLVLKETMATVPVYLDKKDFADLLIRFVDANHRRLRKVIYDRRFVRNPSMVRALTDEFIGAVLDTTFDKLEDGEIDGGERPVQRYTWPYRAGDLIDPDDADDADDDEARAELPPYAGPERRRR